MYLIFSLLYLTPRPGFLPIYYDMCTTLYTVLLNYVFILHNSFCDYCFCYYDYILLLMLLFGLYFQLQCVLNWGVFANVCAGAVYASHYYDYCSISFVLATAVVFVVVVIVVR